MKKFLLFIFFLPVFTMAQYVGLQFDGAGDYIKTGFNGIAGSGSRTVQCWYRGTSSTTQMFLVDMGATSGGNGARFSVKLNPASNVARVEIGGGGLSGNVNIANNFWHQITVVYDAAASTNKYKIYVDGVLDVQGDIAIALNTAATSANPVTIGIRTDLDAGTDLYGGMDDVRIWSVALTPAQITANYNTELCGTPTGLAAYYKMNEGIATSNNTAITSLVDVVTPSSVNTLYGFTLTGNSSNYTTHILNVVNNTASQTLSNCGSYLWPKSGLTYTSSGTYTHTVNISTGCDSVYTLNLTVNPIPPTNITVNTCTNYLWSQTGQTYSTSGNYNDTLVSAGGCDSVVILNLTIAPIAPTVINTSACVSYLWPQNGMTYTSSGTYNDTLMTTAGCDSIISLHLTITSPSSSTLSVSACTNYLWQQNNVTYTTSGTYFDTILNAAGCDSIVQLSLTIGNSATTNLTAVGCGNSYTWPLNNQSYTSSGVYMDTLFTSAGCDSIFILTLTMFNDLNVISNNGSGTLTANVSGGTYQWINCSDNSAIVGATNQTFSPTVNGNYAVITTTSNCSDTSQCLLFNVNGLAELNAGNILVYPNPSTGQFTIESGDQILMKSIVVFDLHGKVLETLSVENTTALIDLYAYDSGIYYITVMTYSSQKMTHRLVKN